MWYLHSKYIVINLLNDERKRTEAIDLQADSMRCIDMNEDTEEVNPTGVFDHDPIIATVALEQRTDTKGTTTLLVPVSALSASDQMKTLRYEQMD